MVPAQPPSLQNDSERDLESLSPLERLPKELAWMVMDYVPESLMKLTLASQSIHARVVEYAFLRPSLPNPQELKMFYIAIAAKRMLKIRIVVRNCVSNVFAMRLVHCNLSINMGPPETTGDAKVYWIVLSPNDEGKLALFRKCIGNRIGIVFLELFKKEKEINAVSGILQGSMFTKLAVKMGSLSECACNFILKAVKEHNVDELKLEVPNNTTSDYVGHLLELSSCVRSLHINQLIDSHTNNNNYFFGVEHSDWASVILEMFSKRIDTMMIENFYFGKKNFDKLRECLPMIGKNVWFFANCGRNDYEDFEYEINDHFVKGFESINYSYLHFLTIKHSSRQQEIIF